MITLYQMHVLDALKQLASESVDSVITSPPYWGLRDYGEDVSVIWDGQKDCEHEFKEIIIPPKHTDSGKEKSTLTGTLTQENTQRTETKYAFCSKCGAWKGQLGLEPDFSLFIKHLCDIFDEIKRVLRKDGCIWVNIGDTYGGGSGHNCDKFQPSVKKGQNVQDNKRFQGMQKCLCMIPERFALEMVARGWILRNKIIWHKPNHMPSSVKDRFANSWEYLFFFTKSRKYYFDLDAVREKQYTEQTLKRYPNLKDRRIVQKEFPNEVMSGKFTDWHVNPLGKNPDDFWEITTQPYPEAHFAVFPEALVERPIKVTPREICKKCGKARVRITETEYQVDGGKGQEKYDTNNESGGFESGACKPQSMKFGRANALRHTKGWSSCSCGVGFRPAVILDPFAGTGTVGKVARDYGRDAILIEIKEDYCKLIYKRLFGMNKPLANVFELIT